jgi:hypothetical protein
VHSSPAWQSCAPQQLAASIQASPQSFWPELQVFGIIGADGFSGGGSDIIPESTRVAGGSDVCPASTGAG